VRPLRMRADIDGRRGIRKVGPGNRVERPGRNGQRPVERIGPPVGADGIAVRSSSDRADYGPAFPRGWRAPADREAGRSAAAGMGGKPYMSCAVAHGGPQPLAAPRRKAKSPQPTWSRAEGFKE